MMMATESEVSYTTSFACPSNRFVPHPPPSLHHHHHHRQQHHPSGVFGDDGLSVVSRRSFYPNTNWTTLPFGEEEEDQED